MFAIVGYGGGGPGEDLTLKETVEAILILFCMLTIGPYLVYPALLISKITGIKKLDVFQDDCGSIYLHMIFIGLMAIHFGAALDFYYGTAFGGIVSIVALVIIAVGTLSVVMG